MNKEYVDLLLNALVYLLSTILVTIFLYMMYSFYEEVTPAYTYSDSNIKLKRHFIVSRYCVSVVYIHVTKECGMGITYVKLWNVIAQVLKMMDANRIMYIEDIHKEVLRIIGRSNLNAEYVNYINESLGIVSEMIVLGLVYEEENTDVYLSPKSYAIWIDDAVKRFVK